MSYGNAVLTGGAIGLTAGAGARLIKNLVDLYRSESDASKEQSVKPFIPAQAEIPVSVTPEEAALLAKRGIQVKRKLKQASVEELTQGLVAGKDAASSILEKSKDRKQVKRVLAKKAGLFDGIVGGATGVGAAGLGWYAIDKLIDNSRKKAAQRDIDELKNRLSKVLNDNPADSDVAVHAMMKAAEDTYFSKQAGLFDGIGMVVGGVGAASLAAAYLMAKRNSASNKKIKALKEMLADQKVETPRAVLVPVLETAGKSPATESALNSGG